MSEEKTRTDARESRLTEAEKRRQLAAFRKRPIDNGYGDVIKPTPEMVHDYAVSIGLRLYRRSGRTRNEHGPFVSKTCTVCGKTFEAMRKSKIYCSAKCARRSYYVANRKGILAYAQIMMADRLAKMEECCESYAAYRQKERRHARRHYEITHPGCKPYSPNMNTRIPDWAVKGQEIMDRRSVFLPGNMSDEQVMAATAIYAIQNAREEVHRPHVRAFFKGR